MAIKIRLMTGLAKSLLLVMLLPFIAPCQGHVQVRPTYDAWQKQVRALKEVKENFVIMPGQVSLVHFPYFGPFNYEKLFCNGREIPFSASDNKAKAYLVQSYFAKEDFSCDFRFSEFDHASSYASLPIGTFTVKEYRYPAEILRVDQKRVVLSDDDKKRVDDEHNIMQGIYENSENKLLFSQPFSSPLSSKITSIYGTKRVFNNQLETQHLGTDFRAGIGTEIFAANSGKVVFTGDLFYAGNTVVIDHGLGIFTSYSHLSQIITSIGEYVTKETLLGLSGMTGRVNGPHLHWGVNVYGNWVDGHSLIEASQKSFLAAEEFQAAHLKGSQ